jgi:crotonobetainyl-CoA:carnitine CoA-transferase CaiB-like acyl-CoA transferase
MESAMFPLEGKKILSFETWGAGAFHAELLALMGAEVINVEDPQQRGNPLRGMGSLYLDEEKQDNEGNQFCLHNKKRLEHRDELTMVLDGVFSQMPTGHWLALLSGVIPCAPVADIRQAFENPFVQSTGKIIIVPYH